MICLLQNNNTVPIPHIQLYHELLYFRYVRLCFMPLLDSNEILRILVFSCCELYFFPRPKLLILFTNIIGHITRYSLVPTIISIVISMFFSQVFVIFSKKSRSSVAPIIDIESPA